MSNLYLIINILVLIGPLSLSFDKKVAFYKYWKALGLSILIMMGVYIPWDIIFTANNIWGFNDQYLTGITIVNLPLEEVLFFITVPYACTFIYACLRAYFKLNIPKISVELIKWTYATALLTIICTQLGQQYSFYTSLCTLITLIFFHFKIKDTLFWSYFLLSYAVSLIPFILVNGILTGTGIENQIVWYNSNDIFNIRILTIPIEDSIYNFGMLLLTIGSYYCIKKEKITFETNK